MLEVGKKAPAFKLKNQDNEDISLKDYAGQKVVIYFYPKDDTPGCTIEANEFTANVAKFKKKNTVILGVSKDSVESHCKFIDKYGLKIDLLSDPSVKMIEKYGVWQEKNNYGKKYMGIVRTTYLIDENGKVEKAWKNVKVKGHVDDVLASV